MSAVIQDRAGSITRTNAGEVDFKLFMYKDRKKKTTKEGDADLSSFVRGFDIYESISNTCMELRLILEDSAGVLQTLTGCLLYTSPSPRDQRGSGLRASG